jgi:flagellar protein FlbD
MIRLTRLNNQSFVLNADLIKFIENAPDTVVTLLTGEKLVVRESAEEVLRKIGEFQSRFHRRTGPGVLFDTSPPKDEDAAPPRRPPGDEKS